jgi:uncharacterized protein (TIGR02246 family)
MTRPAMFVVLFGLMALAGSPVAQARPNDEEAIQKVLSGFSRIWDQADVKAFERLLAEDAQWVTRTGRYLKGRSEIVAHHATVMTDTFKGSRVVWNPLNIKFLRGDVAVAHVAAQMIFSDAAKRPPGSGVVTLVLVKSGSDWLIAAAQNTDSPVKGSQ